MGLVLGKHNSSKCPESKSNKSKQQQQQQKWVREMLSISLHGDLQSSQTPRRAYGPHNFHDVGWSEGKGLSKDLASISFVLCARRGLGVPGGFTVMKASVPGVAPLEGGGTWGSEAQGEEVRSWGHKVAHRPSLEFSPEDGNQRSKAGPAHPPLLHSWPETWPRAPTYASIIAVCYSTWGSHQNWAGVGIMPLNLQNYELNKFSLETWLPQEFCCSNAKLYHLFLEF